MTSNFVGVKVYSHIQELQTFYKEYLIGQTLEAEIRINMGNIFFPDAGWEVFEKVLCCKKSHENQE